MAKIYILTGPAGVGKSTISKSLAEKIGKCAVLEGDDIYHQVVGAEKPWLEGNHTDIMWTNMCDLAWNYLENNIDVIMNYIITPDELDYVVNRLAKFEIHFVTLLADREIIIERDNLREPDCVVNRVDVHLNLFKESNYDEKFVLDTSNLSVDETVEKIYSGEFCLQKEVDKNHFSGLRKVYFDLIKSGEKIYEVRLNDEKRQKINISDKYVFGIEPEKKTLLQKTVVDKLYFKNFEELCESVEPQTIGFSNNEDALKAYKSFYTDEDIEKYGVVAFKLK